MKKKLLLVLAMMTLMLALVCVFASCSKNDPPPIHFCSYGEWKTIKDATCTAKGSKERYCSCGAKEVEDIISRGYHDFMWETTTEATCVADGVKTATCNDCGEKEVEAIISRGYHDFVWETTTEATCTADGIKTGTCECGEKKTETIPAGHNYEKGVCTKCSRGLINIILPETPITVHDYSGSNISVTTKITSLEIGEIEDNLDGKYTIQFYWAGEKIYDRQGNNHSSRCYFGYKLYDSEGFVVYNSKESSTAVKVGEKFKDQDFGPYFLKVDPNETYTLEILNAS